MAGADNVNGSKDFFWNVDNLQSKLADRGGKTDTGDAEHFDAVIKMAEDLGFSSFAKTKELIEDGHFSDEDRAEMDEAVERDTAELKEDAREAYGDDSEMVDQVGLTSTFSGGGTDANSIQADITHFLTASAHRDEHKSEGKWDMEPGMNNGDQRLGRDLADHLESLGYTESAALIRDMVEAGDLDWNSYGSAGDGQHKLVSTIEKEFNEAAGFEPGDDGYTKFDDVKFGHQAEGISV